MSDRLLKIGSGFLCLELLLVGLYICFRSHYRVPIALEQLILEPSVVRLDNLAIGERRKVTVMVTNRGPAINLLKPGADCGCIKAELSKSSLETGGNAELTFTIVAPTIPQNFSRMIRLKSAESSDFNWVLPITGDVTAAVWSDPSELDIRMDEKGVAKGQLEIHSRKGLTFNRLETKPETLITKVLATRSAKYQSESIDQAVEYAMVAADNGNGAIKAIFRDERNSPVELIVPVKWEIRKLLSCIPKTIQLSDPETSQKIASQDIMIAVHDSLADSKPTLKPLVAWIDVSAPKQLSRGKWQARVNVMPGAPGTFDGGIVEILVGSVKSESHRFQVSAR